jgi:hypothetical protein
MKMYIKHSSMNIKLITVVSFFTISTMINCVSQEPIIRDKEDEGIPRVIPKPVARELVAKHTGYEWVDNPFLNTTVEKRVTEIALPPKPDKIIEKYKGKKPVALIDLVVYPHPTRKKCIVLVPIY